MIDQGLLSFLFVAGRQNNSIGNRCESILGHGLIILYPCKKVINIIILTNNAIIADMIQTKALTLLCIYVQGNIMCLAKVYNRLWNLKYCDTCEKDIFIVTCVVAYEVPT